MNDFKVSPFLLQVFGNQSAVAMIGCFLAAQQACRISALFREHPRLLKLSLFLPDYPRNQDWNRQCQLKPLCL
jgi:hypothetical protein